VTVLVIVLVGVPGVMVQVLVLVGVPGVVVQLAVLVIVLVAVGAVRVIVAPTRGNPSKVSSWPLFPVAPASQAVKR
jgi:hypothetical protein